MTRLSTLMYTLLSLPVLGFLLCSCSDSVESQNVTNQQSFVITPTMMSRITLDTAREMPIQAELQLNGRVAADENKQIEVYPFVGGTVTRVLVELGDFVSKGQTLAVIRSGEVAEYERQLIDARSDVQLAQKNLSIQKDMASSRLTSDREVIVAQKELDKANAELRRIEEVYRIYSINSSSEYVVKSPISGFILRKDINADMTLRSDRASSIFTVAELSSVWIVADVYESDISRVAPNMPATIRTVAYPDSVINGLVDKVFNVIDPNTKTMTIRVQLQNRDFHLKPGMAASVKLRYDVSGKGIYVPSTSVIYDKGKSFVMVFHDRTKVETREVDCGEILDNWVHIRSGVADGTVVMSRNQLFIYDALND
jgi:membrane fusion protein, heavy metal efflux system